MLDAFNIIIYITIASLVYSLLIELATPQKGTAANVVRYIVIALVAAIVLYYLWRTYTQGKEIMDNGFGLDEEVEDEDVEQNETMEHVVDDRVTDYTQSEYTPQDHNFNMVNGAKEIKPQLKYTDFKQIYLTPDFLKQFNEAVKDAIGIKRRRLISYRKGLIADLKASERGGKQHPLMGLDKNDDGKMLSSTLNVVDELIKTTKRMEKNLCVDNTRTRLIDALTNRENGIESLTGREDIKDYLALQLYTFSRNPRIFFSNFQNMAIYGPSGVGKTKLAQVIGHVYASSGILIRDHVHVITKQSMTTAYVNESAKMTRRLLLANLESVIFIDEAYDITPPQNLLGVGGMDHGHEALTELVNFLDKMKGLTVVVVAGYEKEMEERFMTANEGLPRRFPHKLKLSPYSTEELTALCIKFTLKVCPDVKFTEREGNHLYTMIDYIDKNHEDVFKNQAGDMENMSASIAKSYYGCPGYSWPKDAKRILFAGVNDFLALKGYSLEE